MEKKSNLAKTDSVNNAAPLKMWVMPEIIEIGKDDVLATYKKGSRYPTEYRETAGPHYDT